jgi:adenylate cyclase
MEFTIIGDTVNTARRMEGLCKDHGVEIIVSAALIAGTPSASQARPLGPAAMRGKDQPVELFVL